MRAAILSYFSVHIAALPNFFYVACREWIRFSAISINDAEWIRFLRHQVFLSLPLLLMLAGWMVDDKYEYFLPCIALNNAPTCFNWQQWIVMCMLINQPWSEWERERHVQSSMGFLFCCHLIHKKYIYKFLLFTVKKSDCERERKQNMMIKKQPHSQTHTAQHSRVQRSIFYFPKNLHQKPEKKCISTTTKNDQTERERKKWNIMLCVCTH